MVLTAEKRRQSRRTPKRQGPVDAARVGDRASTKPPALLRDAERGTLSKTLRLRKFDTVRSPALLILGSRILRSAEVLGDFSGGIVAGGACYAVAWVSAITAEVEILYWGGVAGPA